MLRVVIHIRDTNPKSCIVKLSDYRLFLEDNQDTLFRHKLKAEFVDVDSVEHTSLLVLRLSNACLKTCDVDLDSILLFSKLANGFED